MRTQNSSSRWLIAPALFLAFCSQGTSPSLSAPSTAAPTGTGDVGRVGLSADGDLRVGPGALELVRLRMDRQRPPGVSVLRQYANPGQTYGMIAGETIELWAEWNFTVVPGNPRFKVEWGDGSEPDFINCGPCMLSHSYSNTGRFVVKAMLDDRVNTTVTRTFTLDATEGRKPVSNLTGTTCRDIHEADPGAPSGTYSIDPDGSGPRGTLQAYCDMDHFGGGWTNLNFATNQILLENGNRIDCIGQGGLEQTASTITCHAPLFNYAGGPSVQYLYHYRCDGQDGTMNWLVDHVGIVVGHRESTTLGFATQSNHHTEEHGVSDETNREYCYIDGALALWSDPPCAPYRSIEGNGNCVPGVFTLTR